MPVHIECFIDPANESDLISELLHLLQKRPDHTYTNSENQHILSVYDIKDTEGETVLQAVFHLVMNSGVMEIKDLDLVIADSPVLDVEYVFRLDLPQEGNECYEAAIRDQHIQAETVSRERIPGKLEDTVQRTAVCLFPFDYTLYSTEEAFHADFPDEPEPFLALSGSLLPKEGSSETFSFIIGTVVSGRTHYLQFGDLLCGCTILQVNTPVGILPAIISLDANEELQGGTIIAMYCDVKANLAVDDA
ncbi:MAG: hypothetical protein K6E41_02305 [Solobacterium sp.]|nr:hypothetical protein [Solobacterium sp.]